MQSKATEYLKAQFSDIWMEYAKQHQDDLGVNDWLHIFSALSATVLSMSELHSDGVNRVMQMFADNTAQSFQRMREHSVVLPTH